MAREELKKNPELEARYEAETEELMDGQELSDDELDAVAGGRSFTKNTVTWGPEGPVSKERFI